MSERPRLLRRALEHYASRLTNLQDDTTKLGNNTLKDDLKHDADDALSIATSLLNPELLRITVSDHPTIICSALTCYINDLEDSIKTISDKLGGAKPRLKGIEEEIRLAKEAKEEICHNVQ